MPRHLLSRFPVFATTSRCRSPRLAVVMTTCFSVVAAGVVLGAPQTATASPTGGTVGSVTVTVAPNDAVNVPGMQYQVGFTTSATGALSDSSTITITAPAGTVFFNSVSVEDVTTGQTSDEDADIEGNTAIVPAAENTPIAAGDTVLVTLNNVTNGPHVGTNTMTVATSSDTGQATGTYTMTSAAAVEVPVATVSTQAPGQAATYDLTLTASPAGALAAGFGAIVVAAPAGTIFSAEGGYSIDDITAQQTGGIDPSIGNGGATVTLATPIAIAAGDQVSIAITDVTNPTASGHDTLDLSTTSDTVATSSNSYIIGDSPPVFTAATPPLAAAAGSSQQYTFVTTGYPAAQYTLSAAPSWLHIQPATGQLSGKVPAGTKSFSYAVKATNSSGSAVEGPYQVTIGASATVSGTVTDPSGNPIADVQVDGCDSSGGSCETGTTNDAGAFRLAAPAVSTIVLTAYPPPGSGVTTASTAPLSVPAAGLSKEIIIVQAGVPPIAGTLKINGSSTPTVYWASPSTATITGCANGFATVTMIGQNVETGDYSASVIPLTETPAGSGFYTGTIPPAEPVHGPVEFNSSVTCPPEESTGLLPPGGTASGGTQVLITGSGFTNVTGVSFGNTPAANYTVVSDQAILATAPPGAGTVLVSVVTGGSQSDVGPYTYTEIASVTPAHGPASGGTKVVIKGTGLGTAQAVLFGASGAKFTQVSDTQIDAVSPPGTGTQDISVETAYQGTTPVTDGDEFTYGNSPHAAVSPTTGTASAIPGEPEPSVPTLISQLSRPDLTSPTLVAVLTQLAQDLGAIKGVTGLIQQAAQAIVGHTCGAVRALGQAGLVAALNGKIKQFAQVLYDAVFSNTANIPKYLRFLAEAEFLTLVLAALRVIIILIIAAVAGAIIIIALAKWCGFPFNPNAVMDPSGTVLNTNGHPISGATVTIFRSYTVDGGYLPASTSMPGLVPAVNPEVTKADGVFHWDVSAGFYKVEASAPGCTVPGSKKTTAVIGPYPVPPPQVGLTITLQCPNESKPAAPTVSGLSQTSGPPGGGTVITVLGSNFTPSSKVAFGTTAASAATYLSPQALRVRTPRSRGLADLRVRTAGGTSAQTTADKFFFGAAPAVRQVTPDAGPPAGGSKVAITGTNFTSVRAVEFGGLAASRFTVKSATLIEATAPSGLAGQVSVTVTNPAGSSPPSAGSIFSYLAPVSGYVATAAGVIPVSVTTGRPGPAIKITGVTGIATAPQGQTLYLATKAGVTPVSTASGRPGRTVKTGAGPRAIAITPDGMTAYVVNYGSATVTPVGTVTDLPSRAIKVGKNPDAIAITPNGKTAYVANYAASTVTPITLATGKPGKPIKVGKDPDAIIAAASGTTIWVLSRQAGTITPISTETNKTSRPRRAGQDPVAAAITPNGKTICIVSSTAGTVIPVVTATGRAGKPIRVGQNPDAIVITP